jgi:hypothetical protein
VCIIYLDSVVLHVVDFQLQAPRLKNDLRLNTSGIT